MSTLAKIVPIPKGNYSATATYNSLDIVRNSGKTWMCKQDGITGITPVEGQYWMLIAQDGGGATALSSLSDVTITSPTNGQILLYNSQTGAWENNPFTPTSSTLSGLTDVDITSAQNNNILLYNAVSGKWENGALPSSTATWATTSGKPFENIDTDHFKVTNGNMSVYMPEYYVEVNGSDLAGTYQSADEPVVVPDGALSKPFNLILKNVSTEKRWRTSSYTSSSGGFYVKEVSGSTVYRLRMYMNSTDTYTSSSNYTVNLQYAHATSSLNYTGDYVRLRYIPRYAEIEQNFIYNAEAAMNTTYNYSNFLQMSNYVNGIDSTGSQLTVFKNERYLLFIYSYDATGAYKGVQVFFVYCPNTDNPVPNGVSIKVAGTGIVTPTFSNASASTGVINVAATGSYILNASLYRLYL